MTQKSNSFILLFTLLFISTNLSAKTPTGLVNIKGKVDKDLITIGDRFVYTLNIDYDPKVKINLPPPGANLGIFEIKDYSIVGPKSKGGILSPKRMYIHQKYVLSTFTTGQYVIPSMEIEYVNQQGETKYMPTGEIYIKVESVITSNTETADILDIKPPLSLPISKVWKLIISFLPLLFFATLAWYYYYKRPKLSDIMIDSGPPKQPHEIAFERLEKLQALNLISEGRFKEYYILLSDIMRRYIEGRYSVPAVERTTWELFHELRNVEKKYCSPIKDLLDDSDLVKFAKYIPEIDIVDKHYKKAVEIIDLTKPVVVQQTVELDKSNFPSEKKVDTK